MPSEFPTDQLFTAASFSTVAGGSFFVWLMTGFFRKVAKAKHIGWVAFWALLAALGGHAFSEQPWGFPHFLLILGNTALFAFTALGAQETVTSGPAELSGKAHSEVNPKWWESWLSR